MYICTKYHILMHFLRKITFYFPSKETFFRQKNKFFPDNTRQVMFQCKFFGKTIFLEHLEKWNMAFHSEVKAFLWYICLKLPVYIRSKLREEVPFTLIFIWYNSEPLCLFPHSQTSRNEKSMKTMTSFCILSFASFCSASFFCFVFFLV